MAAEKRALLIVEDEPDINDMYRDFCEIALQELPSEGLAVEGTVHQTFDYFESECILRDQSIDFISIDIALNEQEKKLIKERNWRKEPGGIKILRGLHTLERKPLSVIVTGKTLLPYATDALHVHQVLAFYQKDEFDAERYKSAVKAALWYWHTVELVGRLDSHREVQVAETSWNRTLQAAQVAGIPESSFPQAPRLKIESVRTQF